MSRTRGRLRAGAAAMHALTARLRGGRHTPFPGNYRTQIYVRITDALGTAIIAMCAGLDLTVREGGRTVVVGLVTALLD
jgi:translation elongation factor EF-Tu-like GTPase